MITIVSFGYRHGEPPRADITLDLRDSLRNPQHNEALRHLTGMHQQVRQHVLDTRGARTIILHTAAAASDLQATLPDRQIVVAVGCQGGRHRSVSVAEDIADLLTWLEAPVQVEHRDIDKPLLPLAATG
ncbi:RapZ C-terminal domain-containing protein [Nonomuraea polychroma]|uniref:RapZ C-terminal domain-containing protein n=1 Tax=Nonomuraea polychroma TaxID=46176 RepID=UPI003D918CC7